jgi:hypothetical protein
MHVVLEIRTDSGAGEKIRLQTGETARIGRTTRADFAFPQDTYLSGIHFALTCEEAACRLTDLESSNGTFVNGKQVSECTLSDGDEIVAGHTTFAVHFESEVATAAPPPAQVAEAELAAAHAASTPSTLPLPPVPEASMSPYARRLMDILRAEPAPLFALLDAARDVRVLELLRGSTSEYQSLYEGEKGQELDDYAPYLVSLPPDSELLATLVSEGFSRSWGLFLTCDRPFAKVRRYLRKFLLVKNESGRELYFRFYDPRVMRLFLPTCNAAEAAQIFGPIRSYMVEAVEPETLLRFTNSERGIEQQRLPLSEPNALANSQPFSHTPTAPENAPSR